MKLRFPPDFIFGTSTSSYQVETAHDHDWVGIEALDKNIFHRTTDHEQRIEEDVKIIQSLAPHYRMSLQWSKLQRSPRATLDEETKQEYHILLNGLRAANVEIMMVLHHFANPLWFILHGGWETKKNVSLWINYAKQIIDEYGQYVSYWNTFNEPNLYSTLGFALGIFPPFKKNIFKAIKVISNMSEAHSLIYDYIKQKYPKSLIGISYNCAVFHPQNFWGIMPAKLADFWYMRFLEKYLSKIDYCGLSYYARICFDPQPITNIGTPDKIRSLKKRHDDIWEYYPEGLKDVVTRFWQKYKLPIVITENGICTNDDGLREQSIKDYLSITHDLIRDGVDVRGYYHWSTWDNFEWNLGPTYRFGLYGTDAVTMHRYKKKSADLYAGIAYSKELEIL